MALIAVAADKGAPGVSTVALTLALTWPGEVLLAECDPAGADLPWRMRSRSGQPLSQDTGVLSLASALRGPTGADTAAKRVLEHAQHLDGGLQVLVGPAGPEQAEAVGTGWGRVASALAAVRGLDVVVDCGRVLTPSTLTAPLLQAADLVLLVTRPSLTGVAHLRHGIGVTARIVNASVNALATASPVDLPGATGGVNGGSRGSGGRVPGGRGSGLDRIGVVVVDDGAAGRRGGPRQVDQVLADTAGLADVPVLGVLGWDVRAAAALAGTGWGRGLGRSTLLRTAATTARSVHERVHATDHDAHLVGAGTSAASTGSTTSTTTSIGPSGGGVPDWTWRATDRASGPDGADVPESADRSGEVGPFRSAGGGAR